MTEEIERRRQEHRAQLRAALPAGFMAAPPPPRPNPFAPAGPMAPRGVERLPQWTIPNAFGFDNEGRFDRNLLGQSLGGAAREGAKFAGDVFRPVAQAAGRGFQAAQDWSRERQLPPEMAAQLRQVNERARMAQGALSDMNRREDMRGETYARGNQYMSARLDDARYGDPSSPFIGAAPPEQLSDEDLMAELEALNGMGGPR